MAHIQLMALVTISPLMLNRMALGTLRPLMAPGTKRPLMALGTSYGPRPALCGYMYLLYMYVWFLHNFDEPCFPPAA